MTVTVDTHAERQVGGLLRQWRERRRLSQLDLALAAEISTRHLSFVETGRSQPTAAMIGRLADRLDVPLRERNRLLLAAGYAPAHPQRDMDAPALDAVRGVLGQLLDAHAPYPALVVDRTWTLIEANTGLDLFTDGCAAELLVAPINVLRLALHPDGMAPRVANLAQWRTRLLNRLHRQATLTADADLATLHAELSDYPGGNVPAGADTDTGAVIAPLRYRHRGTELAFISTVATFGAPQDITVAELAIESFYPADPATRERLRHLAT